MKPVNFYLVTDTHYLDNKLEPGGEAFEKNMVTEQYFVKESHSIVSSVFDKIIEDKEIEFILEEKAEGTFLKLLPANNYLHLYEVFLFITHYHL